LSAFSSSSSKETWKHTTKHSKRLDGNFWALLLSFHQNSSALISGFSCAQADGGVAVVSW